MSPEGGRFVIDISVRRLDMYLGLGVVHSWSSDRTTTHGRNGLVFRNVPSLRHRRADVTAVRQEVFPCTGSEGDLIVRPAVNFASLFRKVCEALAGAK